MADYCPFGVDGLPGSLPLCQLNAALLCFFSFFSRSEAADAHNIY
jgi:hypothetical protein